MYASFQSCSYFLRIVHVLAFLEMLGSFLGRWVMQQLINANSELVLIEMVTACVLLLFHKLMQMQ
jgi:hypothetical protein